MNENRVNSIKKAFEGVGPDSTTLYTNQEIVNLLMELQKTMITGVYEKTHAEYMREKDLMVHFSTLAAEYGLRETKTYKRFESNMNDLGYTIGSFIKGMKGEKIARRALKLISFDKNVKILYNIALEDEDVQAEYDAIVLTPYGIFVVEVKNWGAEMHIDENGILRRSDQDIKYDLPGRMSVKEGLLREYLGDIFPDKYQGIVLFSNENAKVQDDYKKMPVCYGGGIVYRIRSFNEGEEILTASQINQIVERIISNHKEQKAPCRVNCEKIVEDYALLMAAIEEAAEGTYSSIEELKNIEQKVEEVVQEIIDRDVKIPEFLNEGGAARDQRIMNMVGGAVGLLVAFGLGIAAAKTVTSRR